MPARPNPFIAAAALVPLIPSALLAAIATRPALAARVFGGEPNPSQHPRDFGLDAIDVDYASGCNAWWVPASGAVGSMVIVHGFETSTDPRATDPGPRLELAAFLTEAGFNCLIISLGYGSRVHPHTGGVLEAADIASATGWASTKGGVPVGVFGFSAGGHAAVAAAKLMDAFAVVTDSSFVDFGEVLSEQGAEVLSVPAWFFGPARTVMTVLTGHAPVDLESSTIDRRTTMLHIHGDADTAIDFSNLARLADVTGGETLVIPGADHLESLTVDPNRYTSEVLSFLRRALDEVADGQL